MVDRNELSRWSIGLEKIRQLRSTVEKNRRKLIDSELSVVSTFRDLAMTESDLNNPDHARRLIEMALRAIRVTRDHMPGLPDEMATKINTQLEQLQSDLLVLQNGLPKPTAGESRKSTRRKPPVSKGKKRVKSHSRATARTRRSRVRH